MPSLSVIVPTLDRMETVERFIDSLNAQTLLPSELVVVDASEVSAEAAYRARLRPDVPLRCLHSAPGLTRQRNVGLAAAAGELIAFFDDDIVLEPEFLAEATRTFEQDAGGRVAVVYGRVTNIPVPRNWATRLHSRIGLLLCRFFYLPSEGSGAFKPSGMPTFVMRSDVGRDTETMPGGLTVYRRDIFQNILFDENLAAYGDMEDDDIGYRISRQFRVVYNPKARCEHRHASGNRQHEHAAARMRVLHHHYLFRKNFPQDLGHRVAHRLSLVGYPLQLAWNLRWRAMIGAVAGLATLRRRPSHPKRASG